MTSQGRRPIEAWEVSNLRRMGDLLMAERIHSRMTVHELAVRSELSARHLYRVERGERRTRSSTLWRIAYALAATSAEADRLYAQLVRTGGAAIAPESAYQDRIESRRRRRRKRRN